MHASSAGATVSSEMKDRSATARSTAPPRSAAVRLRTLHALPHRDPGIGAQRPRELTTPDVDRLDVRRAALEEAVGEPAGRRAGVERADPFDADLEPLERRGELLATTRHVARRRPVDPDRLVVAHLAGRSVGRRTTDEDTPGPDRVDRPRGLVDESPSDELGVEPPPHGLRAPIARVGHLVVGTALAAPALIGRAARRDSPAAGYLGPPADPATGRIGPPPAASQAALRRGKARPRSPGRARRGPRRRTGVAGSGIASPPGGATTAVTPERTSANGQPRASAIAPSVEGRSPTITPRSPKRRRTSPTIGG